jgi:hypothetical protein
MREERNDGSIHFLGFVLIKGITIQARVIHNSFEGRYDLEPLR